ncbi:MAG: GntP family permease, partial [Tidjanibacter sp.]|nr:GntP family permease [Tidjanibacter sp.]
IVGIATTRTWNKAGESISFGLEKMSVVAVLLVGTGAIAGIIKASSLTDLLIGAMGSGEGGRVLLAPLAGAIMSAATASTTAGATVASASFGQTILAAGIPAVWGAAMINAGATVLDHLPHGSFFHATGGSVDMSIKQRLRLIPYESLVGLVLATCSTIAYLLS